MNLIELTESQRDALLDLAMLAMYADGHLAAAEDQRVDELLKAMGPMTEYDRSTRYDASVSRVSRHAHSPTEAIRLGRTLAASFSQPNQKRLVYAFLHDLVASDNRISPEESRWLAAVREVLQP